MRLSKRVAIVTGGAAGIGAAIARRFAAEGAMVAVLDISADGARRMAAEIGEEQSAAFPCDVSREHEVSAAVAAVAARFGGIDILVNDAGIKPMLSPIDQVSESDWDRMIDVHLRGCFLCIRAVVPRMRERGGGAIVNIASLAGIRGRPLRHSYVAAKHGIVGLTRSVAMECLPDNIRVNAVAPGPVATAMAVGGELAADDAEWNRRLDAHRSSGRSEIDFLIRPAAIAAAALFLASDEAPNITGVILPIDGGTMAGSAQP